MSKTGLRFVRLLWYIPHEGTYCANQTYSDYYGLILFLQLQAVVQLSERETETSQREMYH